MLSSILSTALAGLLFSQYAHASSEEASLVRPDNPRICPLPRCHTCPSVEQIHAPGVGFALQMGHGTVVIRHHDGHYQDVARIAASPAYSSLMQELAAGPQNREPDHFDSNWDKLEYVRRRAQRRLNKIMGRPATPETAVLAELVSALKSAAEHQLDGKQIRTAVLSSPDKIRLTPEEITDVFDYLGMTNLMAVPDTLEDLYDASAAYAGSGIGLCSNYTDTYACEREELDFKFHRLLHLDFSQESLIATIKSLSTVKDGRVNMSFLDPEMRLDEQKPWQGKWREDYWEAVAVCIRSLVREFRPQITQLLLTGPAASDARFKNAVREALHDLVSEDVLAALNTEDETEDESGLEFVTARGAAEIAKRRQEGPVRCDEGGLCRRQREQAGRGAAGESETWHDL